MVAFITTTIIKILIIINKTSRVLPTNDIIDGKCTNDILNKVRLMCYYIIYCSIIYIIIYDTTAHMPATKEGKRT